MTSRYAEAIVANLNRAVKGDAVVTWSEDGKDVSIACLCGKPLTVQGSAAHVWRRRVMGRRTDVDRAVGELARALRKKKVMPARQWCRIVAVVMDPEDGQGFAFGGLTVEAVESPAFGKALGECLMAAAMVPPGDDEGTVDTLGRMLLAARSLVKYVESVATVNRCEAQVFERAEILRARGDK